MAMTLASWHAIETENKGRATTEDHCHAVNQHMFDYSFSRVHQTIRCTPAMAAGVTDHLWTMAYLVAIESRECEARYTRYLTILS